MLRIGQRIEGDHVVLALEGHVAGVWVAELARVLEGLGDAAVELDLANVSYVDLPGEKLLRDAIARGARLCARSGFVAALLDEWGGKGVA